MNQLKIFFNNLSQKYKTLNKSRKVIVSLAIFVCFFLLFSDFLMFNNINAYKTLKSESVTLEDQIKDLNKKIENQSTNPTHQSLKPLMEKKNNLRQEVFDLKNKTVSSVNSNEILSFIENSILFSSNLKLISFKNLNIEPQLEKLQKHNFNLQIETKDYTSLSGFIVKLESFSMVNKLSITRNEKALLTSIDFYIFSNSNTLLDISNINNKTN